MFKINRNLQDQFVSFLEQVGLSSFGCYTQTGLGIVNETFSTHPHKDTYICSCEGDPLRDLTCEKHRPNFTYFPENIKVYWVKYPLRQATSNKEISDALWGEIFDKCIKSISQGK
jgi:hypothetical protein